MRITSIIFFLCLISCSPDNERDKVEPEIKIWTEKWGDDTITFEGTFVDDMKNGLCESFYPNNQARSKGHYVNDQKHGLWIQWYKNGERVNTGEFHHGALEGEWVFWYPNGTKQKIEHYEDSVLNGYSTYFHTNGMMDYECYYLDGKLNGLAKYYDSTGVKYREMPFKDNEPHGIEKLYHPNGQLKGTGRMTLGIMVDQWNFWHPNGNRMLSVKFNSEGKEIDTMFQWYSNGKLEKMTIYEVPGIPR